MVNKNDPRFVIFTPYLWTQEDVGDLLEIAAQAGFKFLRHPEDLKDQKTHLMVVHPDSPKDMLNLVNINIIGRVKQDPSLKLVDQRGPISALIHTLLPSQEGVEPGALIPKFGDTKTLMLSLDTYTPLYNTIQGHGRETDEIDVAFQEILELMKRYYARFRPYYAWLNVEDFEWIAFEDILKRKLKEIMWANFFGPAYVEKYGKDFLMNAPGWKKEELDDGGVFLQLSPNFTKNENKNLRAELKAYFAPLKIKRFPWPYGETDAGES